MTDNQRRSLMAAVNSAEILSVLSKLRMQIGEADVESCAQYPNGPQLKSRSHQIQDRERAFGQAVSLKERVDVLLLGTPHRLKGSFCKRNTRFSSKG